MAQYWADWSGDTVGAAPSEFSTPWHGMALTVQTDAEAPSGKRIQQTAGADSRRFAAWDDAAFNADANRDDVIIAGLVRANGFPTTDATIVGIGARVSGTSTTETGIVGVLARKNGRHGLAITQYSSATANVVYDGSDLWVEGEEYWLVLELSGTSATLTLRTAAAPETVIATHSRTVSVDQVGQAGLFNFEGSGGIKDWLALSIATDGDSVLFAPPSAGVDLPLGTATESPAALPVTFGVDQDLDLGVAAESASAIAPAISTDLTLNLGLASAVSAAIGLVMLSNVALGLGQSQVSETALPLTLGQETVSVADNHDSALGTFDTIVDPFSLTPTIPLIPKNPGEVVGWLNFYGRVQWVNGKTPVFTCPFVDYRETQAPDDPDWQMVWRYVDDTDPGTGRIRPWNTFDNGTGGNNSGAGYVHTFSNNTPFTQDHIEIAVKPRFRYLDTQHAIAYAAASAYGHQLPSCNASHYHDQITITSGANTAPGTTLNLYAIRIDDETSQPAGGLDKLNIVLIPGQHSSEDQGSIHAWEIVKRYIDGGASDDWFRQHCRLFVYDANPAGRYYGKERYTEESAGDEDPNRAWDDAGSEQINAVKAAIAIDLASYGNRMDVMYDCHGAYSLNGNPRPAEFGIYDDNSTAAANFKSREQAAMVAAEGNDAQGATYIIRLGDNPVGSAGHYASSVWSAQLPLTPENPIAAEGFPSAEAMYYDRRAAWFRTALENMVSNAELTLTPVTVTTLGLGMAAVTEEARPFGLAPDRELALGTATESASALPVTFTPDQVLALGRADESASALPITFSEDLLLALGIATDTPSAQPIALTTEQALQLGLASALAEAQPLTLVVSGTTGMRVVVGGAWIEGAPYVLSGGIFKLATPYVNTGGAWE